MKTILLLLVILFGASCDNSSIPDDLSQKFILITKGLTQNEVQKVLGPPHKIYKSTLPKGTIWGPQEGLEDDLFPHRKYIEYLYIFNNDEFYIWFSGESETKDHQWRVVAKAQLPVGAVYEAGPIETKE